MAKSIIGSWKQHVQNPRRLHGTRVRNQVIREIQSYFGMLDFIETPTPTLVPNPGMEPHIRPFQLTTGAFLPTSPEFAMKRLLVGGLERIFQISRCFRNEPNSPHHHPEFLMVEWYRAQARIEAIQEDVEGLIRHLARQILNSDRLVFQGQEVRLDLPFLRVTPRSLFREYFGIDIAHATAKELADLAKSHGYWSKESPASPTLSWDDLYFLLWLNGIEPRLPQDRPVFVTDYPASQSALAEVLTHADGTRWAARFEIYIAGLELGNAFQELTDPIEQRARFAKDLALRRSVYGEDFGVRGPDEEFLEALEQGMPPASGIAMGVDRLVLLMADEPDLLYTLWLASTPAL